MCVCMFVCPLQRDYHMKTPCVKAGIPGRICQCSVKHVHKRTHSEPHTRAHKHTHRLKTETGDKGKRGEEEIDMSVS